MSTIRKIEKSDWPHVWEVIKPVFRAGATYAFSPEITEQVAYRVWVELPSAAFVAEDAGEIAGTYYIKPNQPALGSHVCNCGYIVAERARGRGLASRMCEHSQAEAVRLGFRAMQYNLVVSTNEQAIRLWQRHGFKIVGVLPGAFRDPEQGYVDALVMFKQLVA